MASLGSDRRAVVSWPVPHWAARRSLDPSEEGTASPTRPPPLLPALPLPPCRPARPAPFGRWATLPEVVPFLKDALAPTCKAKLTHSRAGEASWAWTPWAHYPTHRPTHAHPPRTRAHTHLSPTHVHAQPVHAVHTRAPHKGPAHMQACACLTRAPHACTHVPSMHAHTLPPLPRCQLQRRRPPLG